MINNTSRQSLLANKGFRNETQLPNLPQELTDYDSWMIARYAYPVATDQAVAPVHEKPANACPSFLRNVFSEDAEFITMVGAKPAE